MAIRENLEEWARVPFESQAHLIAAMRDPQYRDPHNSAYREAVESKVLISSNTGTSTRVYSSTDRLDSALGESDSSVAARRREETEDAERALLEQYGTLALSPAKQAELRRVQRQLPGQDDGYGFQNRGDE